MRLLNGAPVADKIFSSVKRKVAALKKVGTTPYLIVFQVGKNSASTFYISRKKEACKTLGISFEHINCSENISQGELIPLLDQASKNKNTHGIVLQLPLPLRFKQAEIVKHINPAKDLDGLHPLSQGVLVQEGSNKGLLKAAAARAFIEMLNFYGYGKLKSKHIVVIGASSLYGMPLSLYCIREGATVTVCQKSTKNLGTYTKTADLIFSVTGHPGLLKPSMVRSGAIVIDGGFVRDEHGKIVGDVDKRGDWGHVRAMSPVPGGVGRITIACLLDNLVSAAAELGKRGVSNKVAKGENKK